MVEFVSKFDPRDTLDDFTKGYLEACEFTDINGDAEQELQDAKGFHDEAILKAKADCEAFQKFAAELLTLAYERDYDEAQAGRDFWFTRNGHGVGYWDREVLDVGALGDLLTATCKHMSEVYVYAGNDGMIYFG